MNWVFATQSKHNQQNYHFSHCGMFDFSFVFIVGLNPSKHFFLNDSQSISMNKVNVDH